MATGYTAVALKSQLSLWPSLLPLAGMHPMWAWEVLPDMHERPSQSAVLIAFSAFRALGQCLEP